MVRQNELGQPIGDAVENWTPRAWPPRTPMDGRYCRLEPLDPIRQGEMLYRAFGADGGGGNWTYLFVGPFADEASFSAWLESACMGDDPLVSVIIDARSGVPVGMASYMRIDPKVGVIEVGGIHFSPALQRTPAATEAMFLMMRRVFDELGYRRYEWKCDSLNAPSRRAALRLGFTYEGLFRQAIVYKGRNRDTTWFSIIDKEWPAIKASYERWLEPGNFDAAGRQRRGLAQLIDEARRAPSKA